MAVQDDRRELEQIELFGLEQPDASRGGVDAVLKIKDSMVEFELKSTTKSSVTTVRDFGLNHIDKWKNKHWLFGFYTPKGRALMYTRYASPQMIAPWIEEKRLYIYPDYQLSKLAASKLTLNDLTSICGSKATYTLYDAKKLMKKQFSTSEYIELMDLDDGYSPATMLEILRQRCEYVINRGSTLNNPHIPTSVLNNFPKITENHAATLRSLVHKSLKT